MTLVSGIMPTRGRQTFARQALTCFLSQNYPEKELIVLDDADDPSFPNGISIDGVRYIRLSRRKPIAVKRNLCCEVAWGDVILHFDSDDWSAPERMADQIRWLQESGRAVTGYHSMLFYEESSGNVFRYSGASNYAIGTSLAYRREWWVANPFPEDKTIGEDNAFVQRARCAKQLFTVDGSSLVVARVHAENTSPKNLAGENYTPVDPNLLPRGFDASRPAPA